MSISGNNFTRGHGVVDMLTDIVLGPGVSVLGNESKDVVKAFLVGETMERSSESVKTGRERKVRIGESRSNQVSGVSGNISSFVISMDGDVESHEFVELRVGEAKHIGIVSTIVEGSISGGNVLVITVLVGEYNSSNSRALGGKIKAIFEGRFPVLGLVDTTVVGFHEVRLRLAHEDTSRELSHSVHIFRKRLNEGLFFVGEGTSVEKIFLESSHFGITGELSSKEEPESTFRVRLTSGNGLVSVFSNVEEIVTTVRDTVFSVELTGLPEHTGESSHSSENGSNSDVSDDGVGMLFSERDEFLLTSSNDVLHLLFQNSSRERSLG